MATPAQSIADVLSRAADRDDSHDNGELPKAGLPVAGYRAQPQAAIDTVNIFKRAEETLLRMLDDIAEDGEADPRWLAIGRTQIEQGFMAVNRSIFKPERIALPEEDDPVVERGWVIELDNDEISLPAAPLYYSPAFGLDPWSGDHDDAMRFARQEDALIFANCLLGTTSVRICEHQWG